ncbi:RNA polymerase II transcriptional coactivator KELP-like [Chenopodium quinoa]|uniref:RNA polymerase II transcriptional coactivator KELP-like n=1 Tax=Chenopodium quinoa TaxID=63459 RepID=UPI000B79AB13|nr:RNA polymerase II transcriptional coactivator KELP-like [Chenopodium quinoa]
MDAATKEKVQETVLEILRTADMQKMTEFNVRTLAGEKLGIDLSESSSKKFVRQIVEGFLLEQQRQNDAVQGAADEAEQEQEEEEEEEEEESNKRRSDGKEYDDDGDLIICRLSEKRRVTIQDFKGKTLVSIREYYKKDGKFLPTSKGISLTADQWSSFYKNVPAIEKAIEKMEERLS